MKPGESLKEMEARLQKHRRLLRDMQILFEDPREDWLPVQAECRQLEKEIEHLRDELELPPMELKDRVLY